MKSNVTFESSSESETEFAGHCLARILDRPLVVSLCGTLGAGKTRFVKGFAAELDIDTNLVVSPTFSLVNHYPAKKRVQHLDIYRVADSDEMFELGFDEMVEADAFTLIEWGDRFPECLPDDYLKIDFQLAGDQQRKIEFRAVGDLETDLLKRLDSELHKR